MKGHKGKGPELMPHKASKDQPTPKQMIRMMEEKRAPKSSRKR